MSPAVALDYGELTKALANAVAQGNDPLVRALTERSDRNHDLRGTVQQNTDKLYALDAEIKLLKGVIVSLNGTGDGSSGSVPRLEAGVTALRGEVTTLSGDVRGMRGEMQTIGTEIQALRKQSGEQKSWTDGWKGVGVATGIIGACVTLAGSLIAAVIYLFSHGLKP